MSEEELAPISYEDLAEIEDAFAEVDDEIMRRQYELSSSLYARRAEAIAKIPSFWPLVLEQAPPEIEDYITHRDSAVFAEHLVNLSITRPQIEGGKNGNPRSVDITFEFSANDYFEDTTLVKRCWYRRASDGWAGLVSEPVQIKWKKGKDLTDGLTDAAVDLWIARQKAGDSSAKDLPEYRALEKKVENWNGANTSFFTWFGWVSGRRFVSIKESEKANANYTARKKARKAGSKSDAEDIDESDVGEEEDDSAVEVHQYGEEIAASLAEDVWPNAIKFFTQAQELDDNPEADFEDSDLDGDNDSEGEDQPIDLRSLVQGKDKARSTESFGPASKKQKT